MTYVIDSLACTRSEATVYRYFDSFNRQDFSTTVALFAPEGALLAPFEQPLEGPEPILAYLEKEAKGMEAAPKSLEVTTTPEGRMVVVKGSVKAIVFNVNVAWTFWLDSCDRIQQVQVKLLASLQELMQFQPKGEA